MLTDRQQKFYSKIVELSDDSSSASSKERKYLLRTKNEIEGGVRFQYSSTRVTTWQDNWR
ncbi:hypothetical protein [Lactovum odontotermitis]